MVNTVELRLKHPARFGSIGSCYSVTRGLRYRYLPADKKASRQYDWPFRDYQNLYVSPTVE